MTFRRKYSSRNFRQDRKTVMSLILFWDREMTSTLGQRERIVMFSIEDPQTFRVRNWRGRGLVGGREENFCDRTKECE